MTQGSEVRNDPAVGAPALSRRGAQATFLALAAISLLDYTDRWVLSAVLGDVRDSLKLSNLQAGTLTTFFLISYSVVGPIVGYVADRTHRPRLIALGVAVWSLATLGSGFAGSYGQLAAARVLLGVGEGTYGVIAPTILADLFTRGTRSRVMSLFYLTMPVGGAMGMFLGSWMARHYGWHAAFFVVGAPGLLVAFAALFLPDPVRGQSEGVAVARLKAHERAGPSREDYVDLMVNSSYTYSVLGMAFYTFAIGGIAAWMPLFLVFGKGMDSVRATSLLGVTTVFAAVSGMSLGGWLADRLGRTNPRALFLVPGVAMLGSIPFVLLAIYGRGEAVVFGGIFLAEALMFINTGPCNAVIANVVMPNMRASAFAVAIFAVHVLGDIWSPSLMGWVVDTFGRVDSMATPFGQALAAIGALPTTPRPDAPAENLIAGMLVVVPALVLSGGVLLAGARHLPRETALMLAKLKSAPRPSAGG